MENSGPTADVTKDDVRAFFSQTATPSAPFFTEEIAGEIGCSPHDARSRLEDLVERGEIRTKQGGGSGRVWWKPQGQPSSGGQPSEEQFRAFVSAVKDYAIFMLDSDGRIASWNEGAERIKGYSRDEIVGRHFSTFYTDEDLADGVPEQNLERARAEGRIEDEGWRVRADGSRFWANVTITAIWDDEGELQGFTKVTRDMTERREYEQQLKRQAEKLERQRDELEEELDEIFKRVDEAFLALDEEWHITYVNDTAAELVQLPPEELLGARVWDVLYELDDDPLRETVEEAVAANEPLEFEYYSDVLDVWLEIRGYPAESGMSIYFRDITERKERERELQRVRERMEFALNSTDAVVWNWNVDEDRVSCYPSAESLYGTAVESQEDFVELVLPEDRPKANEAIEKTLETGEAKPEEVRILRDEEERWIEFSGHPIEDDGDPTEVIGMARDITRRKTYEQKLKESNERLQHFAYAASHDLQEPLRMVSSFLQLLENQYGDELDEDGEEFIEFAVSGADRMREMIDGLLEYSRVESQGEPLEPVDLNDVLDDVMADLQVQIEEHDAEIAVEELPTVEGDASQLRPLFQNLLDNAIEYSGDEPPRVEISATQSGDEWVISVIDEGIGIDPGDQERIFQVFQRLHTRDQHPGTGIGLALCKRIVERHGGEIRVDSTPGEGATFSLTLQSP